MSYPTQTFNTFDDLLGYINTHWITNGNQEITGVIGNNVVNGELSFIRKSPLNWQKCQISSTGGVVVAMRPVVVIYGITPTSISWTDNIYNEYILINTTSNDIPIGGGLGYYDINAGFKTTLLSGSIIDIFKADNNLWFQGNSNNNSRSVVRQEYTIANESNGFEKTEPTWIGLDIVNIYRDGVGLLVFSETVDPPSDPRYCRWIKTTGTIRVHPDYSFIDGTILIINHNV